MAKAQGMDSAMMKTISESFMGLVETFAKIEEPLTGPMVAAILEETASHYLATGLELLLEERRAALACPECRSGKHHNCTGWAIDEATDEVIACPCPEPAHPFNKDTAMIPAATEAADQEGDSE
jgi:Zn finger protein HypA/HybF involved in hydrogenase expression